jgi:carbamoyl-phosphate synthase large subunit
LDKLLHIIEIETTLESHVDNVAVLKEAKQNGFSDRKIAALWGQTEQKNKACVIQTLQHTYPPFYRRAQFDWLCGSQRWLVLFVPKVLVLGSGPIRIGQGVEFDYATVHSVKAIQAAGYEAIIMNP